MIKSSIVFYKVHRPRNYVQLASKALGKLVIIIILLIKHYTSET